MKYGQALCPIVYKKEIAKGFFDFWIVNEKFAGLAKAGQFVQVLCQGHTLRRPISICEIDKGGALRLVFEVRGEGTRWMSSLDVGDSLDIIAPLGNGFELGDASKRAVFVGGGIGVPPLLEAAKHYGQNAFVVLGFRTAAAAILESDFVKLGCKVRVATQDGSLGFKGLVTDILKQELAGEKFDMMYSCGPIPMLREVSRLAQQHDIQCQVSLEQRMACGVGACLGCSVAVKDGKGGTTYKNVCKDGPVFNSREVEW